VPRVSKTVVITARVSVRVSFFFRAHTDVDAIRQTDREGDRDSKLERVSLFVTNTDVDAD
jgi:hypothetical protein